LGLIKGKSFHWEVITDISLGLSGNDELHQEQLFNKLITAYKETSIAALFLIRLKTFHEIMNNRDDATLLVMSQVSGAELTKVPQGLNGDRGHPFEDQVLKHVDSKTKIRRLRCSPFDPSQG
jgi:hypothetical protein